MAASDINSANNVAKEWRVSIMVRQLDGTEAA
jgi:hypothetical protein